MMEWAFNKFAKKLERSAKHISKDAVKYSSKNINNLFDNKINPLADKLDYIAKKRIEQSVKSTERLESKIKLDIVRLLNNADEKVSRNINKINQIREETLKDIGKTIEDTDFYVENRINQLSFVVMEALNSTQDITQNALSEINLLEENLFQDANQIVDKIDEIIDGKLEAIRNELKKYLAHALPNPLDKCRQLLKIGFKPGAMLSDIELYELSECYELSKLNENTPIDEVLKIYGQLQQNSAMMAALVKKSPELRRRAIEDWIKYGLLCEFWRDTVRNYDNTEIPVSEVQQPYKLLAGN